MGMRWVTMGQMTVGRMMSMMMGKMSRMYMRVKLMSSIVHTRIGTND